ncbi:hypothetical protein E2562_005660 [Oryza meyeriana var. granulata]|uniref:Uncharacterized protein n=1 Tax=Oryza meyeriana var. granulata TaxID=110450 RepID=A0A6G1F471_9ORYZ|nr:hypothetical protein E2562_005660 [Oryza meyeriana var. granulata]
MSGHLPLRSWQIEGVGGTKDFHVDHHTWVVVSGEEEMPIEVGIKLKRRRLLRLQINKEVAMWEITDSKQH